jgi:hypothetical protein
MNLNGDYTYLSRLFSLNPQNPEFRSGFEGRIINRNLVEGVPYQLIPGSQIRGESEIERIANVIISRIVTPFYSNSEAINKQALQTSSIGTAPTFANSYSSERDLGPVFSLVRQLAPSGEAEPYLGLLGQAMSALGAESPEKIRQFLADAQILGISGETVGRIFGAASGWSDLDPASRISIGGGLGIDLLQELDVLNTAQHGELSSLLSKISDPNLVQGALSAVNTLSNWGDMSSEERLSSVIGSADHILKAFDKLGVNTGSLNAVGAAGQVVTGGLQVIQGVKQFQDVIDALGDMPRGSEAVKIGAIGGGSAGMAIGAGAGMVATALGAQIGTGIMPGIGTLIGAGIGALVGCFGSKKKKDQMMRDQWRKGIEKAGFAREVNGQYLVKLANGSEYNLAADGKTKLKNLDGTERKTFDVDLGSKLATDSVPMSQLYSLATGLDPSMNEQRLFERASSQALNAATSNATTLEQVRDNFKSMMAMGNVNPMQLAAKCEFLRVTNKISEAEYGAYINNLNYMFDLKLLPSDRTKAHMAILNELRQNPNPSEQEVDIMILLTDEATYSRSVQELEDRVNPERKKARQRMEAMMLRLSPYYNNIENN